MVSVPKYYYKSNRDSHVAICVPVRDHVTAAFSLSLAMLMKKCGETGQKVSLHMVMGSEVAMQRQQIADEVLETGATHLLWIDADIRFPVHTLEGLLSHDKDIVACNYSTRVAPNRPVAFKSLGDLDSRVFLGTGLESIEAIGFGCILIKREVFENLNRPYFSVEWNKDYTNLVGEDIYFCTKALEAGYSIWLEHDISKSISHVGTRAYTIQGDCNE